MNGKKCQSSVNEKKTEQGATVVTYQGVTTYNDNSQKSVARCRPYIKEQISSEGTTKILGSPIDTESYIMPIYAAQTTSTRGTNVLTDDMTWNFQDIPELGPQNEPWISIINMDTRQRTLTERYVDYIQTTEG